MFLVLYFISFFIFYIHSLDIYISHYHGNNINNCGTIYNPCKTLSFVFQNNENINISIYLDKYNYNISNININNKNIFIYGNNSNIYCNHNTNGFIISNSLFYIENTFFNNYSNTPIILNNTESSFINCSFINNTGELGGCIYAFNTSLTIFNSLFLQNTAKQGGSIYINGLNSTVNIGSSYFSLNKASISGGAIYSQVDTLLLNNCSFINNIVRQILQDDSGGGALHIKVNSTLINSCLFKNNSVIWHSNECLLNDLGGGALYGEGYMNSLSNITIYNSTFVNNNLDGKFNYPGGAITLVKNIYFVNISYCEIVDHYIELNPVSLSEIKGGILALVCISAYISDLNCINNYVITANINSIIGGLYYILINDNIQIYNSLWENNTLYLYAPYEISISGAVIFIGEMEYNKQFNIHIENSSFIETTIEISFLTAHLQLDGIFLIGYLSTQNLNTLIKDCIFISNNIFLINQAGASYYLYGGALYINTDSEIINSLFFNNSIIDTSDIPSTDSYGSLLGGTIFFDYSSKNNILRNCSFINNHISSSSFGSIYIKGAGIYSYEYISITECLFHNNSIDIYKTINVQAAAIYCDRLHSESSIFSYNYINSNHNNNINILGGTITITLYSNFYNSILNNNYITTNSFGFGGAIYCYDSCNFNTCNISNNYIKSDNLQGRGGAIYVVRNLVLTYSTMSNNSGDYGAAICSETNSIYIHNSTISDNFAIHAGGFLYLDICSNISLETIILSNNSALAYGDNFASKPCQLITLYESFLVMPMIDFSMNFSLIDSFDNLIGDPSYPLYINTHRDPSFNSFNQKDIIFPFHPYYEIYGIKMLSPLGSVHSIDFSVVSPTNEAYNTSVDISVVNCIPGYYLSANILCQKCENGYYTLQTNECIVCPTLRDCMKSYLGKTNHSTIFGPGLIPHPYYNPTTTIICPNTNACLEIQCNLLNNNNTYSWIIDCSSNNNTYNCISGYTERLCSKCECNNNECWYIMKNECIKCSYKPLYVFISVIIFLLLTILLLIFPKKGFFVALAQLLLFIILGILQFMSWFMVLTSVWVFILASILNDNIREAPMKSFLSLLQLLQFITLQDIWPSFLSDNFNSQIDGISIFGAECIFPWLSNHPEVKFITFMLLPIILLVFILFIGIVTSIIRKYFKHNNEDEYQQINSENENNTQQLSLVSVATLKTVLFIAFSSYVPLCSSILTILQPCSYGYVKAIPWLECSNNSIFILLIVFACIFFILYVIGIPLYFSILLWICKNKLNESHPLVKAVQFLHQEYRPKMYQFELIWLLERLIIVTGFVYLSSSPWQFVIVNISICLAIFIQLITKPYILESDNIIEILCFIILNIYFTTSWNIVYFESQKYILQNLSFIILLLIIVFFICITFIPSFWKYFKSKLL